MIPQTKLLFYTAATGPYAAFLPLYVYFAHDSNPGAAFEFIVDDVDRVEAAYGSALDALRREGGISVRLREAGPLSKKVAMQNTLRFVVEPETMANYVYIGDIDILIVEDVMARHKRIFDDGLPYSNIIRPGTTRLSGLHFTRYDTYYPLPEINDIISSVRNDEEVLYRVVARKGHLERQSEIDAHRIGRPAHGIHMSPNRIPLSDASFKLHWGITWALAEKTWKLMKTKDFPVFVSLLPSDTRLYLANLYYILRGMVEAGKEVFTLFNDGTEAGTSAAVFSEIFRNNVWRGTESVSGPSSSMERTQSLREALPQLIETYGIKTFLDAPCGDFHWMSAIAPTLDVTYIGSDIVPDLVRRNAAHHRHTNVSFRQLDLTRDSLPQADILFCRDCLFHLSYADIAKVFKNFLASECRFLMTTSHVNRTGFNNCDIKTGEWRWFDLFKAPFDFPSNHVEAVLDGGGDRYMYLWRKDDISPALAAFVAAHEKSVS